ncbi:hypothetical protein Patl1_11051 [Pistacia atlantica]|uniref:Uncharacterized protein n=1 Tax=Pistacia atlantica TaxID=434234 RepID=A0ACC1A6C6_9ROSI|nr:hypothetical protein Patl1_11051 [Pistacia atlantica]
MLRIDQTRGVKEISLFHTWDLRNYSFFNFRHQIPLPPLHLLSFE